MPFRQPDLNTLAADVADAIRQLSDVSCVTENDPKQGPSGSATAVSLAWNTLRTNIISALATQSVANINRAQDFLDKAPTLRYRGTP